MNRLILVEGLPGSGKSSTAQWLHHSFSQLNISSRWFYELSQRHPLTHRSDRSQMSASQLLSESEANWQRFIQTGMNEREVIIIDSGFFQKDIMHMMNLNIDSKDIQKYAKRIDALVSQYDTHFIYLNTGNAETHMRWAFQARGKNFQNALTQWSNNSQYSVSNEYLGLDGCLQYWSDYKSLCDGIFEKSNLKKIELDVTTGRWTKHYQALSRFLKFSEYKNTHCSSMLSEKLIGDYVMRNSDKVVSIKGKGDVLVISNLLPVLEAESFMIPADSNRFFIRGHDVSLQFGGFRKGLAEVMNVSSSWRDLDGMVFERI